MPRIKIISNPYKHSVEFQSWSPADNKWSDINSCICPNSQLLNEKIKNGFFPFFAKQIVDILVKEYSNGAEILEIEFEGTEDEFAELKSICSRAEYKAQVSLSKSKLYLENGRDILQDVIKVFRELTPLVEDCAADNNAMQKEMERFSDATDSAVPICVIGNYSSGKSTFINALIGYELLPSSDEPTTAKIYKITQSKYRDRAKLMFDCGGIPVSLLLRAKRYILNTEAADNPLLNEIKSCLDEISERPIYMKLNNVLKIINTFANEEQSVEISDLIQVETPFSDVGIFDKSRNDFVIFDTPGSNSATSVKHYDVLKKAMSQFTNGLLIFVSECDSLDSTDNDKLYQDINNLEELDKRFTMIIVNKADRADLKREDCTDSESKKILSYAIPRKLYAGGIYYVSSIIGLGSKNGGRFICEHSGEIFEDQCRKYSDPEAKNYKRLYRHNIFSSQIKEKLDELSLRQTNLLYANSGLYAAEQAIETFADVYSHYNKCRQAELFIRNVISITSQQIETAKKSAEDYKNRIGREFEKGKQELIHEMEKTSHDCSDTYKSEYDSLFTNVHTEFRDKYTRKKLNRMERELRENKITEKAVIGKKGQLNESIKSRSVSCFNSDGQAAKGEKNKLLRSSHVIAWKNRRSMDMEHCISAETKRSVKREVEEEILKKTKARFEEEIEKIKNRLESESAFFWTDKTDKFRDELLKQTAETTLLQESQRDKISGIILKYPPIDFHVCADELFDKAKMFNRFWGNSVHLRHGKLIRQYNKNMDNLEKELYEKLRNAYCNSFDLWRESLVDTIRENIEDFNPDLNNQKIIIEKEASRIQKLERKISLLQGYDEKIREMMAWKEA